MTEAEFNEEVRKFDWFYEMSDDGRVYDRGKIHEAKILAAARGNKQFQAIWNREYAKRYHRHPFSPPHTFPFPEVEPAP